LGGGTKLKTIEALAMERPLVGTPKGVAGIDVVDGVHALVRDRDESFADAVIELLNHPDRRAEIGAASRDLAKEYSWTEIMERTTGRLAEWLE
jgi:glycosyltransferase involved in cell wall biosynthesis